MERQELDALVSVLVSSHPIQALPVVCGRGEGSTYSEDVASSHDLLANGIRFQILHIGQYSSEHLKHVQVEKNRILRDLHVAVAETWNAHLQRTVIVAGSIPEADLESLVPEASVLDTCYRHMSDAARAYQAQYPGTPDMRILQVSSVCRGSMVHEQALSHIKAREQAFEGETSSACTSLTPNHHYHDIIKAYVLHMAGLYGASETSAARGDTRLEV